MRAAHNNAQNRQGQSGAGFLPDVRVVHVVERRVGRHEVKGQWLDVWHAEGQHDRTEFAGRAADVLRAQGFTVRVRPVVL